MSTSGSFLPASILPSAEYTPRMNNIQSCPLLKGCKYHVGCGSCQAERCTKVFLWKSDFQMLLLALHPLSQNNHCRWETCKISLD